MKNLDIPKRLVNPLLELIKTETEDGQQDVIFKGDFFCEIGTDITKCNEVWHVPGVTTNNLRHVLEEAGWEILYHDSEVVNIFTGTPNKEFNESYDIDANIAFIASKALK